MKAGWEPNVNTSLRIQKVIGFLWGSFVCDGSLMLHNAAEYITSRWKIVKLLSILFFQRYRLCRF